MMLERKAADEQAIGSEIVHAGFTKFLMEWKGSMVVGVKLGYAWLGMGSALVILASTHHLACDGVLNSLPFCIYENAGWAAVGKVKGEPGLALKYLPSMLWEHTQLKPKGIQQCT